MGKKDHKKKKSHSTKKSSSSSSSPKKVKVGKRKPSCGSARRTFVQLNKSLAALQKKVSKELEK